MRKELSAMRTTLFAFVGAASIVLAGPIAFAGSDAYPDLSGQAIYASPPSAPTQAEAYQDAGSVSAPPTFTKPRPICFITKFPSNACTASSSP